MVDVSQYKVGLVLSVEPCSAGGKAGGKTLRSCKTNVGDEDNPVTIVTSATNVREGSRVAVALAGSTFVNDEGEDVTVRKTAVGGVMSDGMFCDSRMLGWSGGAAGVAAQIPNNIEIGSSPPASKPRPNDDGSGGGGGDSGDAPQPEVKGLFEKKLTKEEKKKLAEEKRKARKAAKEAKKAAQEVEE